MQPISPKFALIIKLFFMRSIFTLLTFVFIAAISTAQVTEHTYRFTDYHIKPVGNYQTVVLGGTQLTGAPGQPLLAYCAVSLLLPPGEVAESIEIMGENEVVIPGSFNLFPAQNDAPISMGSDGLFQKNEETYSSTSFPLVNHSSITTQYLNGFAFAVALFTPMRYNPSTGQLSYYSSVKVRIHSKPGKSAIEALGNLSASENVLLRVRSFAQNPDMIDRYPLNGPKQAYQLLIISPSTLSSGFTPLVNYYATAGIDAQVVTTESIYSGTTGTDKQDKIRNYIRNEYQSNSIEYVILGGDTNLIPSRGFYCYAVSGSGYEDYEIPADLYYSGMDGSYNYDGDNVYGEALTDSVDLLPELAVGRFPVSNATELQNMVHKSVTYQTTPIASDMNKPLFLGELLMESPLTLGQDYLNLLIDNRTDNGYTTSGIPSAENTIDSLYDQWIDPPGYAAEWPFNSMVTAVNNGSSFIHHVGHSSETYMMKMSDWDLNTSTFSNLDGVSHSYGLLYTHGCLCGAFDYDDCIAEKSVTMSNFLASGIFNSRYGWFNEGQTEGPSQHLHREFVNAIYNPALNIRNLGDAFVMSKIETAPWVDLTGEYEFGAQRWVHYDNNILGDPALRIWVNEVETAIEEPTQNTIDVFPNPSNGQFSVNLAEESNVQIFNVLGECVFSATQVQGVLSVDLVNAGTGIYLLQITGATTSSSSKLIVE
jgi:hypothetical protein